MGRDPAKEAAPTQQQAGAARGTLSRVTSRGSLFTRCARRRGSRRVNERYLAQACDETVNAPRQSQLLCVRCDG